MISCPLKELSPFSTSRRVARTGKIRALDPTLLSPPSPLERQAQLALYMMRWQTEHTDVRHSKLGQPDETRRVQRTHMRPLTPPRMYRHFSECKNVANRKHSLKL